MTSKYGSSASTTSNRSLNCCCLFSSPSPKASNCIFCGLNFVPNCTDFV
nr:MAG TPA: protein of unknown function (DUF4666) [Caudoviricetes sp.]